MPPAHDENAEGKSAVSVDVDAKGVLAMADRSSTHRKMKPVHILNF